MTNVVNQVVDNNKGAFETAAKIKLGKAALKAVGETLKDKLPAPFNNFVNKPIGYLIMANILTVVAEKYDNDKLSEIADAAMLVGYSEVLDQIDIDGFVDDIMGKIGK